MSDYNPNDPLGNQNASSASPYSYNTSYTGGANVADASTAYSQASAADDGNWTCPSCGSTSAGSFCGNCGTPRPVASANYANPVETATATGAATYDYNPTNTYTAPQAASTSQRGKGAAVASLVLGILALLGFWTTIPAIILGAIGIVCFIVAAVQGYKGGIKVGGLITSLIGVVLAIGMTVFAVYVVNNSGTLESITEGEVNQIVTEATNTGTITVDGGFAFANETGYTINLYINSSSDSTWGDKVESAMSTDTSAVIAFDDLDATSGSSFDVGTINSEGVNFDFYNVTITEGDSLVMTASGNNATLKVTNSSGKVTSYDAEGYES